MDNALDHELAGMRRAKPDQLRARLRRAVRKLRPLITAGELDRGQTETHLISMAAACGLDRAEAEEIVTRGGLLTPTEDRDAAGVADILADADDGRAVVQVVASKLHEAVDAAEQVLIDSGPGPIFQRAGQLVHIADRPARRVDRPARAGREASAIDVQEQIVAIDHAALLEQLGRVARFEKFDARAKGGGEWRAIDPPRKVAEAYFGRARWRIADLHMLVGTPTLRSDGTLLDKQGYDPATGLYLTASLPGLRVPERPTNREAERANEVLVGLFDSFPFVDSAQGGVSLAVVVAGLIAAVLRPTIPAAPLIGVTAPTSGTGKSYLIDVIAMVATGCRAVAVTTGSDSEEFEKSLGAALLGGRPLLLLDNLVQPLAGQLLCVALTQERVDIRLLGLSKMVAAPTAAALFATGNNLRVRDDAARRVLLCRLDAKVEQPEDREFDGNVLAEAERRRGDLVSAALTIARWQFQRGDPAPPSVRRFAGFEVWCARVRDGLVALGHADPVAALDTTRATDIDAGYRRALVGAWAARLGDRPVTCAEVITLASHTDPVTFKLTMPDLNEALMAVAADRGGRINPRRLGNYIAAIEGRIVAGRCFVRAGTDHKVMVWKLVTQSSAGG